MHSLTLFLFFLPALNYVGTQAEGLQETAPRIFKNSQFTISFENKSVLHETVAREKALKNRTEVKLMKHDLTRSSVDSQRRPMPSP